MDFSLFGLSPLVLLLVIAGALIFLKMLKWIMLIVLLIVVYFVIQLGLIPGVTL